MIWEYYELKGLLSNSIYCLHRALIILLGTETLHVIICDSPIMCGTSLLHQNELALPVGLNEFFVFFGRITLL